MKKITDYAELVKAKHALNKTIAPVEDGASMAGSYTSGKQFIRDSVLYSALTSIAAGTAWSSLTLDTDYEVADDVSTQIAAVNQTLTNQITELSTKVSSMNVEKIEMVSYAVVADGVKTWRELLGEAAVKAQTLVTQKGLDQYQFANIWLQGIGTFYLCDSIILAKTDAVIDVGFYNLDSGGGGVTLKKVAFRNTAANCFISIWDGSAYSEISSQVPTNGTNIVVKFIGYKFAS